jgi:hypothetical protein
LFIEKDLKMKKLVLVFAAVLLSLASKAAHNVTPTMYKILSGTTSQLAILSNVSDTLYWECQYANDSLFTSFLITPAGDSGILTSGTSFSVSHTVSSAPISYARVRTRTSPSGVWDTSIFLKLKRRPTVSAVVTPGIHQIYSIITVNSGGDDVMMTKTLWLDAAHTSPWNYGSTMISGNGTTWTITDSTPVSTVLPFNTPHWPEFRIINSVDTARFDTMVYTLPLLTAPTVDTYATATVTDTMVTLHLLTDVLGSSGAYIVVYERDSLLNIIDSQQHTLLAMAGVQYWDPSFHPLQRNRTYVYSAKVHNSVGNTWSANMQYKTLIAPAALAFDIISAHQESATGNLLVKSGWVNAPGGICDYSVFVARGTADNIILTFPHNGNVTATGDFTDAFVVPTAATYFIYAYGHDATSPLMYSDTIKTGLWPTAIETLTTPVEDADISIMNMNGHCVEHYSAKMNEPLWHYGVYPSGLYIVEIKTATSILHARKVF